jgi:phosphoglycerate dehydrogenase-like enzyme
MKKIMLVRSNGLRQEYIKEIIGLYGDSSFITADDRRDDIYSCASGINAIIGCPRSLMTAELIQIAGSSLEWIHHNGAGCETLFFDELVDREIVLTNGRIIQGPEVADHAFALLLTLTRNMPHYIRNPFEVAPSRPLELKGKTALIIGGGGGIGMLISERASVFGMNVIAVDDDYVNLTSFIQRAVLSENLLDTLPDADVVFMAAPLTPVTVGSINKNTLKQFKHGSYFINISRGQTVVTEDLVSALKSGLLRGVGLDVTDPEPLPADHILRHLHNVVLTPHIAGLSDRNHQRSFNLITDNISRYIKGLPLINIVDKRLHY